MICTLTIEQKEDGVMMEVNFGDDANRESPNYAQRSMAIISTFADNLLKGNFPEEVITAILSVGQAVENDD